MNSLVRTLLLWLFATYAAGADAKVVRWLYDVDVPVVSQTERQRAARAGLGELLIRVTGLQELPPNAEIQAALREPHKYYDRFEFATRQRTGPRDEPDSPEQTYLKIHYEPAAVLALVRRAALPVWSADRPTVLAWIAVENGESRRVLAASDADAVVDALRRRTRQRGLELRLPLMDLMDWAITPATVWGRFWEPIELASARYGMDVILLGRLARRADGSWTSEWELRSAASRDIDFGGRSGSRADAAPAAAAAGVDVAAGVLADRFAVGGRLDAIAVTIRGASTVAAYAAVLDYLRSREYIERMEVKSVARDALTLHLHSRSSSDQLEELLSIGSVLAAVSRTGELARGRSPAGGRSRGRSLELAWRGEG